MLADRSAVLSKARPRPPNKRSSSITVPATRDAIAPAAAAARSAEDESIYAQHALCKTGEPSAPRTPRMLASPRMSEMRGSGQRSVSMPAATISTNASPAMESDLGLDLPVDLARAIRRRDLRKRSSQRAREGDENAPARNASSSKQGTQHDDPEAEPGSSSEKPSASRRALEQLSAQSPRPTTTYASGHDGAHNAHPTDTSVDSMLSTDSMDGLSSLDLSELTRAQLEQRLEQATLIIKERERDLGIAAAVGNALLQKNMSLREHHAEVTARLPASLDSLEAIASGQVPLTIPLPQYSPPHSDMMSNRPNAAADQDEDRTPRIQQTSFFDHISPDARDEVESRFPADNEVHSQDSWMMGDDQMAKGTIPSSETRRQLDQICAQNDHLLEQLAQLQEENENAKRKDSKRLKKLKREIDGLHCELEAAEARNTQLEQDALAREKSVAEEQQEAHNPSESVPETFRKDDVKGMEQRAQAEQSTELQQYGSRRQSRTDPITPGKNSHRRTMTESERVLVEQLLRKVHELEEMNAALTQEANERDSRIGRFLLDSERLCDMYDAVESEVATEFGSVDLDQPPLCSTSHWETPSPASQSSPLEIRRRRGTGNQHLIEGRKTLRRVLRSPGESGQLASPFSAPRPRIFVTPSIEDLREKMLREKDEERRCKSAEPAELAPAFGDHDDDVPGFHNQPEMSSGLHSLQSEMDLQQAMEDPSTASAMATRSPPQPRDVGPYNTRSLRSVSSNLSLRSAAESDIADTWKGESSASFECDESASPFKRLTIDNNQLPSDMPQYPSHHLALRHWTDGDWYAGVESRSIQPGSLCDGQQTSYESYDYIERFTAQAPVAWADDEDFGKPITSRQALRFGLLSPTGVLRRKVSSGLLKWIRPNRRSGKGKDKQYEAPSEPQYKQIESSEDVAQREEDRALLRLQRQTALKWRVANGQMSKQEANRRGAYDQVSIEYPSYDEDRHNRMIDQVAFEAEVTRRTFAHRNFNRRQGLSRESPKKDTRRDYETRDREARERERRNSVRSRSLSVIERYHPRALRQRAHHLSVEMLTWIAAWAAFSVVMVLAFIATFARGPRRVLQGRRI